MNFRPLGLAGAWVVQMKRHEDERGWFARLHCEREFAAHGLPERFVQSNLSFNRRCGTVRGLHFQWPPSREGKLVRCIRGRIFDVLVDLRPDSRTFTAHVSVELAEGSEESVFIPAGFAHGFQSLRDDTEVLYLMGDFYAAELSTGLRFDDPAFAVRWPHPVTSISERDAQAARFQEAEFVAEYRARAGTANPAGEVT
jgi:dTDP-4-dehydrorhamnose 3,5-epimerase